MCTLSWAAETIGVSRRQVGRLVTARKLTAVRPLVGRHESSRHHQLLFATEVRQFARAYKLTKGQPSG